MENECSNNYAETLQGLENEVRNLELKLQEAKASAVALKARMLVEEIAESGMVIADKEVHSRISIFQPFGGDTEEEESLPEEISPLPEITLADLPTRHSMRRKWKLESDFPIVIPSDDDAYDMSIGSEFAQEGHLRLFGLRPNGEPWECSIAYSDLMNNGGVTIGRDADMADIVLDDSSVSRCHARLELTDRGVVITDERSTNGTGINDITLTNYDRQAVLNNGDILNIAEISLIVEVL